MSKYYLPQNLFHAFEWERISPTLNHHCCEIILFQSQWIYFLQKAQAKASLNTNDFIKPLFFTVLSSVRPINYISAKHEEDK